MSLGSQPGLAHWTVPYPAVPRRAASGNFSVACSRIDSPAVRQAYGSAIGIALRFVSAACPTTLSRSQSSTQGVSLGGGSLTRTTTGGPRLRAPESTAGDVVALSSRS